MVLNTKRAGLGPLVAYQAVRTAGGFFMGCYPLLFACLFGFADRFFMIPAR